jgi:hypothetical protein
MQTLTAGKILFLPEVHFWDFYPNDDYCGKVLSNNPQQPNNQILFCLQQGQNQALQTLIGRR